MISSEVTSALPLPPSIFFQLYTDENVRKGWVPKPPPPPAPHETYNMFGVNFHAEDAIIRPLESQGIPRLYPQIYDHCRELKKLNHSTLVSFMDLLDVMITNPESPKRADKIEDLKLLFIHMHHLINEFRPHQARETLRMMMVIQNRRTKETCDQFQKDLAKAIDMVKDALNVLPDPREDDESELDAILPPAKKMKTEDPASCKDRIMCEISDTLWCS